ARLDVDGATVTVSSTHTCTVIDRCRSSRSASAPTTPTTSAATRAIAKISARSRIAGLVAVADTPDGDDAPRRRRVVLDLLPETPHVHRHRGLVAERPAPHPFEQ